MGTAAIIENADQIDPFATECVEIPASKLKECMVLMDPELGTPLLWLDHKMRTVRNSGSVRWLAHNLETGRIEEVSLRPMKPYSMLAA